MRVRLRQRLDQQGDFAADAIAGGQFAARIGYRSAQKLLVNLGQLAGYDDAQAGPQDGFQIGKRLENAVRRLVKDEGARGFGVAAASAARASSRVRRAPAFSGRKPRK